MGNGYSTVGGFTRLTQLHAPQFQRSRTEYAAADVTQTAALPSPAVRRAPPWLPAAVISSQVQLSAPPVPPLCIVPANIITHVRHNLHKSQAYRSCWQCAGSGACTNHGHGLLLNMRGWAQATAHRIVLSVRNRIHCGMGRFCLAFLASFILMRKVFCDGCSTETQQPWSCWRPTL